MKLVKIIKQTDQDRTLECECHNRPAQVLYRMRDEDAAPNQDFDMCLTEFLKTRDYDNLVCPVCTEVITKDGDPCSECALNTLQFGVAV